VTDESARAAAERLCDFSRDTRMAVVLDDRGELAGGSDQDRERSRALADLVGQLLEAVDDTAPGPSAEQIEAQVEGGAVYVVRGANRTLAAVARREALSSLMFYDLRSVLSELEGARE
jgi:hypothetical protein